MSAQKKLKYSVEDYLTFEANSEFRHEYWKGEIFDMSGASPEHNQITSNVSFRLNSKLVNRPCSVFISDMRVLVSSTGLYTYPDVVVVCGQQQYEKIAGLQTLINPTVLVEVFSPSTRDYDLGGKFAHYRTIESLKEYVLIDQEQPYLVLYSKQISGNWLLSEVNGLDEIVNLTSIDCQLILREVYQKVIDSNVN